MTNDTPDPESPLDDFDLIDEQVASVTDEEIADRLRQMLVDNGCAPDGRGQRGHGGQRGHQGHGGHVPPPPKG